MRPITTVHPGAYAVHALRLLTYKGRSFSAISGDSAFLRAVRGNASVIDFSD
jgi:hypothetical protein